MENLDLDSKATKKYRTREGQTAKDDYVTVVMDALLTRVNSSRGGGQKLRDNETDAEL